MNSEVMPPRHRGRPSNAELATRQSAEAPQTTVEITPSIPDGWSPMDSAPKNRIILLKHAKSGHEIMGLFRRTRRNINGRWMHNEFWSDPLTGRAVGFLPFCWKERL
jgi:hypothetical protein